MPSASDPHPPPAPEAVTSEPGRRAARKAGRGHERSDATDLRPIGKARLRALREAIRNGTYPSVELAEKGLLRMFTRPATRRPR